MIYNVWEYDAKMISYGLRKHTFSEISDHALDQVVRQLTEDFPNCGENMIGQVWRGKGVTVQRFRIELTKMGFLEDRDVVCVGKSITSKVQINYGISIQTTSWYVGT